MLTYPFLSLPIQSDPILILLHHLIQLFFHDPEMFIKRLHRRVQIFFHQRIIDPPVGTPQEFCPHLIHQDPRPKILYEFVHQAVQH